MTYVSNSLAKMNELGKSRRDFLTSLLETMLANPGKATFRNLSRFGPYCEKSYGRHFERHFDWARFNRHLIEEELGRETLCVVDASFIAKSGKRTFGLGRFFDARLGKSQRGLEVSALALVNAATRRGYTLSAQQTPPTGRMDHYIGHYKAMLAHLPAQVRHVVADGGYACKRFIEAVRASKRHLVTRLRSNANLYHLYRGGPTGQPGRPRRYDGKVDLSQTRRMECVGEIEPGILLYTAVVNSPRFKRDLRIAYLRDQRPGREGRYIVLTSTDLSLSARQIVAYYSLRFQIEFIFRDAKQHTGLSDCQARSQRKLDFHFNACLSALNLARLKWKEQTKSKEQNVFSMASIKRISFNELFMDRLFLQLGLEPLLLKMHPAYERMRSYGAIAA